MQKSALLVLVEDGALLLLLPNNSIMSNWQTQAKPGPALRRPLSFIKSVSPLIQNYVFKHPSP